MLIVFKPPLDSRSFSRSFWKVGLQVWKKAGNPDRPLWPLPKWFSQPWFIVCGNWPSQYTQRYTQRFPSNGPLQSCDFLHWNPLGSKKHRYLLIWETPGQIPLDCTVRLQLTNVVFATMRQLCIQYGGPLSCSATAVPRYLALLGMISQNKQWHLGHFDLTGFCFTGKLDVGFDGQSKAVRSQQGWIY